MRKDLYAFVDARQSACVSARDGQRKLGARYFVAALASDCWQRWNRISLRPFVKTYLPAMATSSQSNLKFEPS